MDCDLIVIGSGFGGSVCALRAAAAGMRVVVLERGRRMTDEAYERVARGRLPLFHRKHKPGLVEVMLIKGLHCAVCSAVGGGSHIYTGVTVPAPPEVFNSAWPRRLTHKAMQTYYGCVEQVIAPRPTPTPPLRTRTLQDIGRKLGAAVTLLPLAMDFPEAGDENHDGRYAKTLRGAATTWLRGGPSCRKRTLDRTYLAQAERAGADVRPLHEACNIIPIGDGYRVDCRRWSEDGWADTSVTGRRVIVAAGTLNTLRLLLRCRDIEKSLPNLGRRLGEHFFLNGDFGGLLVGRKMNVEVDEGPPVTAWVDLWDKSRMFLMETGAFVRGLAWSFGVMGFDDHPGRIQLDRNGRLAHEYDTRCTLSCKWTCLLNCNGGEAMSFHRARKENLRALAGAAHAHLLTPPDLATRMMPATIHPVGGAALADDVDRGVTNDVGEVFGYPGLYVADGSLLPTPAGVAPSMTIAALAEHVAENMIRNG